jgi:glycosyltransferase involved in cell wall biosynthesis
MKLIVAATALRLYPLGKPAPFYGGSEKMVHELAKGLAKKHTVHVITPDLEAEEQRGPTLWYWPPTHHPTKADAVVSVHGLNDLAYDADLLVWAPNGVGADTAGLEGDVDAVATFSEVHSDLIAQTTGIPREKCVLTGLGVDLDPYPLDDQSVPGRMYVANDPVRGLWHVLDVFDLVKKEIPEASLHVGYDFDRQFDTHRWHQNALAEMLWECRDRMCTPGVVNLGALSPPEVILQQIECQVHCWPSDPPNAGSQTWGLLQAECAAAGCALVLSDVESFGEVFREGATVLPTIGHYFQANERRIDAQDYADIVIRLMKDPKLYAKQRRKAQKLAAKHTWSRCISRWNEMLCRLSETEE